MTHYGRSLASLVLVIFEKNWHLRHLFGSCDTYLLVCAACKQLTANCLVTSLQSVQYVSCAKAEVRGWNESTQGKSADVF